MSASLPTPTPSKIQSLEGLRGVCACWVVAGHVAMTLGWHSWVLSHNKLAVDVFIMLSGFVIARLIARKHEAYLPYITRRVFRIFPLYLLVLAISCAMLPLHLSAWSGIPIATPENANRLALATAGLAQLPLHLLTHIPLLQGLVPDRWMHDDAYTLVGQAWSVSLEWQFYLVAPMLAVLLRGRNELAGSRRAAGFDWRLVGALALAVVLMLATRFMSGAFLGAGIALFLVGMLSYRLIVEPDDRRATMAALCVAAALAVHQSGKIEVIPLVIWAIVLLPATARVGLLDWPRRILASRPMVALGERTYSIYLVHMIPMVATVAALNHIHASVWVYDVVLPVVTIAATWGLAVLASRYVERPGIALGARVARGRGVGAVAAVGV